MPHFPPVAELRNLLEKGAAEVIHMGFPAKVYPIDQNLSAVVGK